MNAVSTAPAVSDCDDPFPSCRVDPDSGLPIYSIDALKIGRGAGNTKDCPIDCNCCF